MTWKWLSIIGWALVAACAAAEAPVGDGARPEDEGETLRQGLVTCAPRAATGYAAGQPFGIVVVEADGKPAEVETANAYHLMQRAAEAGGVGLRIVSGFRSQAEQQHLYACYVNCSCNNCNLAAYPGYSNHQSGSALDLNTHEPGVYGWLARNAARFGFYETVPGEDWHWEFFGPAPGPGPCAADGGPAGPTLRFVSPREGGRYTNGLWLKAHVSEPARLVRYSADGWFLAASEDAADDFSARYVFNQLGPRELVAEAIDEGGRVLAASKIRVEVTAGEAPGAALAFASPRQDGWYRNGVRLTVDAGPEVAAVTYSAGPWVLGRSADRASGFAVRAVFSTLGYRALRAVAVDAAGREVARRSVAARVLPGEEGPVGLRIVAPSPGSSASGAVRLVAVGSDSIARVEYSADGWPLAAVSGRATFEAEYTFNTPGVRRVRAVGFDAGGAQVAEDLVELTVR